VTKLVPFGAFVKVADGIEGLVHISELAERHVEVPEAVVNVGDKIEVKVIDIDTVRRRISLSLKQAQAPTAVADESAYDEGPAVETAYSSGDDDSAGGGTLAAAFAQAGFGRDEASMTPEEMALAEAEIPTGSPAAPVEEPTEEPAEEEAAPEVDAEPAAEERGAPEDAAAQDDSSDEDEQSSDEDVSADDDEQQA
jgi:small subunit ribosomal protein S1